MTLPPLDHQRKLFTNEGAGTMNMVEFFSDMSHGQIDVGKSRSSGDIDWTACAATTSATSTRSLTANSIATDFWTRQRLPQRLPRWMSRSSTAPWPEDMAAPTCAAESASWPRCADAN